MHSSCFLFKDTGQECWSGLCVRAPPRSGPETVAPRTPGCLLTLMVRWDEERAVSQSQVSVAQLHYRHY